MRDPDDFDPTPDSADDNPEDGLPGPYDLEPPLDPEEEAVIGEARFGPRYGTPTPRGSHLVLLTMMHAFFAEMRALPTPPDDRVADILGEVRALEVALAKWRQGLTAETPDVAGQDYALKTTRKAVRTYNTAAILHAINPDTSAALRLLHGHDAVRLNWQWEKLCLFFADRGLRLRVEKHAIPNDGDMDGPMVGEVWVSYTPPPKPKEREDYHDR